MGEMVDMYRERNADKKAKAAENEKKNMALIKAWCDQEPNRRRHIRDYGGIIGFRFPGKKTADFYPTKNKWRVGSAIYYGDAEKFINWFERRRRDGNN